jgi:hypothetical protein
VDHHHCVCLRTCTTRKTIHCEQAPRVERTITTQRSVFDNHNNNIKHRSMQSHATHIANALHSRRTPSCYCLLVCVDYCNPKWHLLLRTHMPHCLFFDLPLFETIAARSGRGAVENKYLLHKCVAWLWAAMIGLLEARKKGSPKAPKVPQGSSKIPPKEPKAPQGSQTFPHFTLRTC